MDIGSKSIGSLSEELVLGASNYILRQNEVARYNFWVYD